MSIKANWSYPTAIRFGAGRISEIADACKVAGIKKPLLVTDRGLANMAITTKTLDLLKAAGNGKSVHWCGGQAHRTAPLQCLQAMAQDGSCSSRGP